MDTRSDPTIDLFAPYEMGPLRLENRMVMAPLTRSRAEAGNVPSRMAATYYSQRAQAGLVITEATQASAGGQGYIDTPGIHTDDQVRGWRKVTEAVHRAGGLVFVQLWHVGRVSHPDFRGGELPVAPSAIAPRGVQTYTAQGLKDIPAPRALDAEELPEIVREFRAAGENAKAAGFDGVEVHGANGYLLDQFLESGTNQRTDSYGGSVENRARLLFEVIDDLMTVWGPERIGVRLSPGGTFNDMCDANPRETWGYVAKRMAALKLAYLHLIEPAPAQGEHATPDLSARFFRPLFPRTLIVAGGYTLERGNAVLRAGLADLVAFGRLFLANPDLVERLRRGSALNEPNPDTFYGGGAEGYIDYPALGQAKAA